MESQRKFVLCDYHYDPLDRLISHSHPDKPDRQRYYCQSKLATEIQGAIQHSIFQHADQLLAQQTREGDAVDATLLSVDQQRSVLHTLNQNNRRQSIKYSAYGRRSPENGLISLLGFNGERLDPVTGHYLLGSYRAFNPWLMRFNSPDSLSPFGNGGFNCYAYCSNDPINFYDPTGLSGIKVAVNIARWRARAGLKQTSARAKEAAAVAKSRTINRYPGNNPVYWEVQEPKFGRVAVDKRNEMRHNDYLSNHYAGNNEFFDVAKKAREDNAKLVASGYGREFRTPELQVVEHLQDLKSNRSAYDGERLKTIKPGLRELGRELIARLDRINEREAENLSHRNVDIRDEYFRR
ncbi:MAG: yd repeat-containing protein, partial [Pseudomonas sp.]|nr:yd repeat-containing protein [Pseudomonas sp.]